MAVLKPRNRLVYFRVSEDEFQQFAGLCEKEGARSISDLARDAMHRLMSESGYAKHNGGLAPQVAMLDRLISQLSAQLQQLILLEGHKLAPSNGRNGDAPNDGSSHRAQNGSPTEPGTQGD